MNGHERAASDVLEGIYRTVCQRGWQRIAVGYREHRALCRFCVVSRPEAVVVGIGLALVDVFYDISVVFRRVVFVIKRCHVRRKVERDRL